MNRAAATTSALPGARAFADAAPFVHHATRLIAAPP